MIIREIKCLCGRTETEPEENAGWAGWGQLHGVNINGMDNPTLCPSCLADIAKVAEVMGATYGMD